MARLFDELRRRKVLKTLGIYIVVAWGLLQFTEMAAGIWEMPGWVPQSVFVVLVLGVPVAGLLSWFFNVAPDTGTFSTSRGTLGVWVVAATLVAVIVLPYLWPDDLPNEDSRRLATLANQLSTHPRALHYGLYGLNAPAGSDIWIQGHHRVAAFNTLGQMPAFEGEPLRIPLTTGDLCSFRVPDCLDRMAGELDGLPSLLAANAEMLDRYRSLRASGHFGGVVRIGHDTPMPEYRQLMIAQRLLLRAAMFEYHHGDPERAFGILADELGFHRSILARSTNILDKMIMLAIIAEDIHAYAALSAIAESPPPAPARLSAPERSLVDAYQWEAIYNLETLTGLDRTTYLSLGQWAPAGRAWFHVLPFKRTRTANRVVTDILDAARASLSSAAEFVAADPGPSLEASPFETYVNGAGAMILRASPDFHVYNWRLHDADALIVLAQVARHLQTRRVSATAIDNELLALPPALRSPYDGRPPTWSDGMLRFEVPGPEGRRPVELVLGLPSASPG